MSQILACKERHWTRAHWPERPDGPRLWQSQPTPTDPTGEAELIEQRRSIVIHAQRKHFRFPCACWDFKPIEQSQHSLDAINTKDAMLRIHPLPGQQKPLVLGDRNRLDLRPQLVDRQPVNSRQQATVAPFDLRNAWMKLASQNETLGLQSEKGALNFRKGQQKEICQRVRSDRSRHFHSSSNQFSHSIGSFPSACSF